MIDPFTAFAAAQAAVAGIQKAIKLGKDVNGLVGEFSRFFDARDAVQKAANDAGKKGQSDTGRAMEIVMQQNKLREDMEHLKHQLVYGGYPELWTLFLQKHMEIQRARKKREAEEKAAKLKRRQEQAMFVLYTIITVAFVSFLIGFVYIVMHV